MPAIVERNFGPPIIEYYSGSQVTVFIDDIWIDDTASYTLSVSQGKQVISGYGSQHYDLIAKGKVLITGDITLNFKDPNYLWIILANKDLKTVAPDLDEDRRIKDELSRPAASDFFINRLTQTENTKDFSSLSDKFKEQYWGEQKGTILLDDEPTNHRPFDINFLYKGDSPGVIETVKDVEILSFQKGVNSSGEVIQVTYSFVARKLV